jgi:hypothetical protein
VVVIERFLAEAVTSQKEPTTGSGWQTIATGGLGTTVIDGKGKHALQTVDTVWSPCFVGVQDHLGIGTRTEALSCCFQFSAQIEKVIDFAIVDDPTGFIFVRVSVHRGYRWR